MYIVDIVNIPVILKYNVIYMCLFNPEALRQMSCKNSIDRNLIKEHSRGLEHFI